MDGVETGGGSSLALSQLRPSVQWNHVLASLVQPDPYCTPYLVEVVTRVTGAALTLVGILTHGQASMCGLVADRARYLSRQLPP